MTLKRLAIVAVLVWLATSGWISAQLPRVWLDSLPSTFLSRSPHCLPPDIELPVDEMVAFSGRTGNQFWRAVKNAPEASGVVRISATGRLLQPGYHCVPGPPFWACDDAGTSHMELGLRIAVPGLVELPPRPGLYVRCGDTATCSDQDNASPSHPMVFFGVAELLVKVQTLAQRFQALYPDLELRLTDMSLPMGGLFDYGAEWEPPHNRHRNGRSVDISWWAWNKATGERQWLSDGLYGDLYKIAVEKLHMHRIREGTIHFELVPLLPADPCHP